MRGLIGILAKDLPRYLPALVRGGSAYLAIHNRDERLSAAPDGRGFRCEWEWTSNLHAPARIPSLGRLLMERALADHPIRLAAEPAAKDEPPDVSFLIGHRGTERMPLLMATLASIAAQRGVRVEAIVVEQAPVAELRGALPEWVGYIHTPVPAGTPYNRAWALNVAARAARASCLVLHDNDLLVPEDYASLVARHVAQGSEVVNLKRFIFYLGEKDAATLQECRAVEPVAPVAVMQNALGGGSLAVGRDAFARLGGLDEGFVGWGGEDNEFWSRCALARRWEYGYLSLVHLWHAPQPDKAWANPSIDRLRRVETLSPEYRVEKLAALGWGATDAPQPDAFVSSRGCE